jgi:SPP1 family predicted phage head-tail adaptor
MRAGLLRERIEFLELNEVHTDSGSVKKEYTPIYTCRAYKKKEIVYSNDGMNAKEDFIDRSITFHVRKCLCINDKQRILYNGKQYDIILLDYQIRDNTYMITCKEINI